MYSQFKGVLEEEIQKIKDEGLFKKERVISTPQTQRLKRMAKEYSTSAPIIISDSPPILK